MSDVVRRRLETLGRERLGRAVPGLNSETDGATEGRSSPSGRDELREKGLPAKTVSDADRRPAPLRSFGRAHALVVIALAVLGLGWAGWSIFSGRVTPVAAATPSPQVIPAVSSETPTPSAAPQVRVHVLGAVATPGVVSLDAGSRVEDALAAAGGLTKGAQPADLNLAAVVPDGAQVVIGDSGSPGGELRGAGEAGVGDSATGLVNLNTATTSQLEELPGVGPVTAGSIVTWRETHGPFTDVSQLDNVDGIGKATLARLEPHVTA